MRRINPVRDFFHRESAGGVALSIAAIAGLVVANSPLSDRYFSILDHSFSLGSEALYLKLTVVKVINYLLMTFFFLIVGLEIKRELTSGHLATVRSALAPLLAAIGGMLLPALLYLAIAGREAPSGWGVPVATDIALAIGLLGAMGSSVVPALRTFLLGLAVIDDIGAIVIIAFVYSRGVEFGWVISALVLVCIVAIMKRTGIEKLFIYLILGALLWYGLYRSGVHPTLAGVILGIMAPAREKKSTELSDGEDGNVSIIDWLIERIHPWSTFFIVPLFAFANTGVVITRQSLSDAVSSPIAWGIAAGLILGKPLGIMAVLWGATRARISEYPRGAHPRQILATGSAAGIGFTVAIFIAELAFTSDEMRDIAVIAVIGASLLSGALSWLLFSIGKEKPRHL